MNLPITQVTLLEDRAYVVREASVELPAGSTTLKLSDVTPILADKTVTGRILDNKSPARVLDVQVVRVQRLPSEADPTSWMEIEKAIERCQRESTRLKADRAVLDGELASVRKLTGQLLEEMAQDVTWGRADAAEWERRLRSQEEWEVTLQDRRLELDAGLAERTAQAREQTAELRRRRELKPQLCADLQLDLEASEACTVRVRVEYCVAGAAWRPYHGATLNSREDRVEIRCDGCVWQNTGEDWTDVQLFFSTRRPSLGTSPPVLAPDFLTTQKKSAETVVASRDEVLQDAGLDDDLQLSLRTAPREVSTELPGLDDGGEALLLQAPERCSVPSDGRPVRVTLFSFESEARVQRVLMPELSTAVVLKSVQTNTGSRPLLAGPVDLVRECGRVGRTQVLFLAAGESFPLGWGPDPMVRAQRKTERGKEDTQFMSGWVKVDHTVEVQLSNLGVEPLALEVVERIPVSEVKQVEIALDSKATSDGFSADANGFVKWKVELGPRERRTLRLVYQLKRRKEVVGV